MIEFRMSMDPDSKDVARDGRVIGFIQRHDDDNRFVSHRESLILSLEEMKSITEQLEGFVRDAKSQG